MNLILVLETVLSLWLLLDALRRRASPLWMLVILLPFGELVYFFQVKLRDPEMAPLRRALGLEEGRKVSLQPLREALEEIPSYSNTLALAEALDERGDHGESAELFRRALELDEDSKEALYGLARSRLGQDRFGEAIPELERLIEKDPAFRDYAAWAHLAYALWREGDKEGAFRRLAELVELSPRLSHRTLYAHYLQQEGRREEAERQLSLGLQEYEEAPSFLQGRNEAWARQARQMLREVSSDRGGLSRSPV